MALRITIDLFSGRPNPTIELDDAQLPKRMTRSEVRKLASAAVRDDTQSSILGYRGIILEETNPQSNAFGRHRIAEDSGAIAELLGHKGQTPLADFILSMKRTAENRQLRRALSAFREFAGEHERHRHGKHRPAAACKCAPLYEPAWWNDAGQHQWNNNCYNYSTNYRTDTFAQPGQAAGQQYTTLDCPAVHAAALADDLLDTPLKNKCPKEGHLVALVIAPGFDYHWYRKGRNGLWTHKPGGTPVTNLDNSGNIITDPRTADRGPYTVFCHFMVVMHGHIKIR